MRLLLTGASGFVGAEILRLLREQGEDVTLALRHPQRARPGMALRVMPDLADLRESDADRLLDGMDALIHAAGHAHAGPDSDPSLHARVNARASAVLAEAAARRGMRMIYLSSIKAMGPPDAEGLLREGILREPEDAYGRAKREAEQAIRTLLPEDHVILRPALVAGPGAKGNLAMLLKLARLPFPLPFAGVNAPRSLVSRLDLATISIRALREPGWGGRSLIVADPQPLTPGAMLTALRAGLGRPPGLFAVNERLLERLVRALGRADWADRLFSPLRAEPSFLRARGWEPIQPAFAALRELAAQSPDGSG